EFAQSLGVVFKYLPQSEWQTWAESLIRAALDCSAERQPVIGQDLRRVLSYVLKVGGRFQEAIDVSLKYLESDRRIRDEFPERYIESLYDVIELYDSLSLPRMIEPLCQEAISFQSTLTGEMGIRYADSLFSLAALYFNTSRESQGKALYEHIE